MYVKSVISSHQLLDLARSLEYSSSDNKYLNNYDWSSEK